jgi:hypothetical protein|tara:strand:+ start:1712 stop:3187 length:1476 start_codon:yes stop_codon:yes gene_type:complete
MVAFKHPDEIDKAGDYNLSHIDLINHKGDTLDLKLIVVELNIYESIYKNAVTGTVVITDAKNQIGRLQIQGLERISFKLSTPGASKKNVTLDASAETGEPFHVYKITDRKQAGPGVLMYTLHFASREFMRNIRTKVSQAYEGRLDEAVQSIFKDKDYLDSRKRLKFEPTGNADKIVIPNLRPFDAIQMIAEKSLPEKSGGTGYFFYETTKAYHFRSWESMVTTQGSAKRVPKQTFFYMPLKHKDDNIKDEIGHKFKSVQSYRFINNFHDVAANTALGTYGQRVITHNLYDKSYNIADYNYHNSYQQSVHTDYTNDYTDRYKYAIATTPVDYDNVKGVSDYPESLTTLQSTTQFLHNTPSGGYGINVFADGYMKSKRISQFNQILHGTCLKLVVKGQSYLEPGDLIEFRMRPVDSDPTDVEEDYRYGGQYIISKIRHQVTTEDYVMVLECAKDSVVNPVVMGSPEYVANSERAELYDIYENEGTSHLTNIHG